LGVASGTVVTLAVGPILVLLATILGGRGRPLVSAIVGSIMSLGGLVLVCGPEALLLGADSRSVVGVAYAFICGIGFAGMTAVNRRPIEHLGPITLVGLTFCGSGLLAMSAVALEPTSDVRLTEASIAWFLFISIVPTALGYVAYFAGLARGVPASSALISTLLELVSAASLAVLVLHESIGIMTAAGSALIVGAAIVMRPKTYG
jgi:drug/metabolite transporter, DME family